MLVTFLLFAGIFAFLFGRLVYLCVWEAEHYASMATDLHERERSIKAARGRILDCNGKVLADNKTVCTVSVIYNQIKNREEVIAMLCKELELTEEYVRKRVEKYSSMERIKSNVDKEVGDRIREYDLAGVKVDEDYFVYSTGKEQDVFVKDAYRNEFHGKVWPGDCAFPDFTRPETRAWWGKLYKDFLSCGIDGIWNDMNEPSVFDGPGGTMPESCIHLGGGNLPTGTHGMYHNAYGRLMVEASRDGILAANPDKRPFILSRSNLLGGQRYAAMWTGDNGASYDHMKLSVPMSLTLGLSGQPFNGPDIGGFANETAPDLWGHWIGFGAFFPFSRGHASCDTSDKEPWAYTKEVEKESRMAIERRYRLMPYLYTAFYNAHKDGQPVMAPVFFADPADVSLRAEEQAFMLGEDILVIPAFAENPALPKGIWEKMSLVKGDTEGKYQADMRVRGGSIIPVGKVVQNLTENVFDPLTLVVVLDEEGKASGSLYWDEGDGWGFRNGEYKIVDFTARQNGNKVAVAISDSEGSFPLDFRKVNVEVLKGGKVYRSSGTLDSPITVNI